MDADVYEVMRRAIEMEKAPHLNLLATTEEYLNETAYWHFKQEQWIVAG